MKIKNLKVAFVLFIFVTTSNFGYFPYSFECRIWILIALIPGYCLPSILLYTPLAFLCVPGSPGTCSDRTGCYDDTL